MISSAASSGEVRAIKHEIGTLGCVIRVGDPRELRDHTGARAGVEALPVPLLADFERRGHMD
jgi:hypothetical protein